MMHSTDEHKREERSSAEPYVVRDPERFALNLARALEEAGKAAAEWARSREQEGAKHQRVTEPVTDMVKTLTTIANYWMSDPTRALEAQTRLFAGYMGVWANSISRLSGEDSQVPTIAPEPGDKRFQDPEWTRNAFFDFLKQVYLVTTRWAYDLVESTGELDDHARSKARFYVRQAADALSPSNFLLTNPQILRETLETDGENLVRGMHMLAEDIASGKGELRLRQVDTSKFRLGENLAATPGRVVARSELAEIIQYAPTTEKVLRRPLLIVPPWINKFYVLDLTPERSFIRWAVDQGHSVFVISWVNPGQRHGTKGWDDYIRDGIDFALDAIAAETGEKTVNAIGYCVGGTLLAADLALMAQENDGRIASATLFAAQVDFTHAGDLKVFVDEAQIAAIEKAMGETGYLDGTYMASAFNLLRARDLIWPYVVNNYLRGREPLPFDILYWNADCTRVAAANHSFYLRNCYLENRLAEGRMELRGRRLSLSDIKVPVYSLATLEDHIAPARSVFLGSRLFGGPMEFVLAGSGHIAGVVNPPGQRKYQHWTSGASAETLEDWLSAAHSTPGSWWPHWQKWIESQDGERVAARALKSRRRTLGNAPGIYVLDRV